MLIISPVMSSSIYGVAKSPKVYQLGFIANILPSFHWNVVISTGTTVSMQTVYRRLVHIGLYARRPVRCVPLTATQYRLRLTLRSEHALWTPQQWSCVMFSLTNPGFV
ncbi:transposable element Tcb1 transposase [Trichonephila clavipes]|nr:transposable element Tcb1 transposase [Trichonephila clavipes]